MGEFICIIFFVAIYLISKARLERKVDNYDMSKVSIGKMAMDDRKSYTEIKRNLVAGKYDKDVQWKI